MSPKWKVYSQNTRSSLQDPARQHQHTTFDDAAFQSGFKANDSGMKSPPFSVVVSGGQCFHAALFGDDFDE